MKKKKNNYTEYYTMEGEGGRFGLSICMLCGSAIILDKDDATKIHDKWHESLLTP